MTDEEKAAAAAEEKRLADLAEEKRLAKLAAEEELEGVDKDKLAKLIDKRVATELKDIKEKLNGAYTQRDEAKKRTEELENAAKEAHKKRLEDEGKHTELLQLELKEEREKRAAAEKRNTELSRDVAVRAALNGLDFRNERAAELAYKEIVGELVQDSKGEWAHKSGISISDYIADFAKDEAQSFLFKTKANNGGGSSNNNSGTQTSKQKDSLFSMSQAEVLKLAEQGKLNKRK
jgi:hypothetical protein